MFFRKFFQKGSLGFSLVEIMVTIAIIGTLAAIAVPVTLAQKANGTKTAEKADLLNVSTQLEAALTSWNGTPPAQVTIATSANTWTATPSGQSTAVSGLTSAGTSIAGTMWVDGSYCLTATNTSGATLIFRSDRDAVEETGTCPAVALGSVGTIPSSVATTLPAAPTGLVATSPSNASIAVSWTAVSGATSYTVKIPGLDAVSTTSTAATISGVNAGSNTVTVYAKNANGSGAGATTTATVASGATGDSLPAGAVITTTQGTVPDGWLLADGSAVSRTAYATLYAAIGTTYGTGDGSTTFNLPNLKGRVVVGQDASQTEFTSVGQTGGEKLHTLTTAEMPSHTHTFSATTSTNGAHTHTYYKAFNNGVSSYGGSNWNVWGGDQANTTSSAGDHAHTVSGTTAATGSGTAFTNLSPYIVLRYIIKTTPATLPDTAMETRVASLETRTTALETKKPRVVYVSDTRSGCPATLAANSPAVSYTFTLTRASDVVVNVNTIGSSTGRFDTFLNVDGVDVRLTLSDTTNAAWKPAVIDWAGNLAAGSHTIYYKSSTANVLGCGSVWGGLSLQFFDN